MYASKYAELRRTHRYSITQGSLKYKECEKMRACEKDDTGKKPMSLVHLRYEELAEEYFG